MIRHELIEELENITGKGRVLTEEPLSGHCSFRTGGPADLMIRVGTAGELQRVLALLEEEGTEVFLLGRGTNLLIGDRGYRGAVITMTDPAGHASSDAAGEEASGDLDRAPLCRISLEGRTLTAGAGASLQRIALTAARAGLAGLSFAAGIPGSLGGGIVMNAGAYGGEMKQVVKSVTILEKGKVRTLSCQEMDFGYRTSYMKHTDGAVLSARMELTPGDPGEILEEIRSLAVKRREKQPLEYASAGSTFKRPQGPGLYAGRLIQDAGLRGYACGDAQVSEKHCGFVINRGSASAAQIRRVIEDVRTRVFEQTGILLEREVIYLGDF